MQLHCVLLLAFWLNLGLGVSAVEFQVDFENQPASVSFNTFYDRYELSLELKITEVGQQKSCSVSRVVTGLTVTAEKAMSITEFGAPVIARVYIGGTSGQLVFECSTLKRCMQIRNKIAAMPSVIQQAVVFTPIGLQGGLPTQFATVRSAGRPAAGSAIVFQRHVDTSNAFAQNWATYETGFEDSKGNFWLGLRQLADLTQGGNCKLIYDATLFNNTVVTSTYRDFQVLGAEENYKLRVGDVEGDSPWAEMKYHDQMEFSTFDRDNDMFEGSCSKIQGKDGGWWFNMCHFHNLNGRIASASQVNDAYDFCSSRLKASSSFIFLKKTKLSFKCF